MTTYNIGGVNYYYAQWDDAEETDRMRLYINEEGTGWNTFYRTDPWEYWDDIFTSGIYIRPYCPEPNEAYDWDDVNEEWVANQTVFTPWLKNQLGEYRNEKMFVPVTYNNGIEDFTDVLSLETMTALNLIAEGVTIKNDPSLYIDFKGSEDWATMTAADAQGFFKAMFSHQQKCFSAERAVWSNHQITPYELWEDAKQAYDTALEA